MPKVARLLTALLAGALLLSALSTGCALVSAGASHVTTPVRRAFVGEQEAFESLSRYFDVAEKVVALYDDETACHTICLASYFKSLLYILPSVPETKVSDGPCEKTLDRFSDAAQEAFGGTFSPCLGGNPWFGDVLEWVLQKPTEDSASADEVKAARRERMVRVDQEAIRRLELLRSRHPSNPIVALVANAFLYERSTCCKDVTAFADWWKAADLRVPTTRLRSESWSVLQLGYDLQRRFPSWSDTEYDSTALAARQALVAESLSCSAIEPIRYRRLLNYRVNDACGLLVDGSSHTGRQITQFCGRPPV
ncbi:MAG TPA: hypothetical protein VGS03_13210 [Candidatus Polarisedimenticolia bacterium]|jgi:hypothetical protein|nr:hypothetical protein [Candidatus Polarisedimenticolia bacterium]